MREAFSRERTVFEAAHLRMKTIAIIFSFRDQKEISVDRMKLKDIQGPIAGLCKQIASKLTQES